MAEMDDREFQLLISLLQRYVEQELDQWEAWRFTTQYGDVYVDIRRQLPPDGERHELYEPVPEVSDEQLRHLDNARIRRLLERIDEQQDKIDEVRQLLDLYHTAIPTHAEGEWLENVRRLQRDAGDDPDK